MKGLAEQINEVVTSVDSERFNSYDAALQDVETLEYMAAIALLLMSEHIPDDPKSFQGQLFRNFHRLHQKLRNRLPAISLET